MGSCTAHFIRDNRRGRQIKKGGLALCGLLLPEDSFQDVLRLNLFYDPEWNKETEEENDLIKTIRESHVI